MAAVVCIPMNSEVDFPFPHILSHTRLLFSRSEHSDLMKSHAARAHAHTHINNWLQWVTQKQQKKKGMKMGGNVGEIQKDLDERNMNKIHCIHV